MTFTRKVIGLALALVAINLVVWIWALISFNTHPALLSTALLAYLFGLRHAVDADHIAAIDNITRKLMQEGKRPIGVGISFSLGHSTVVIGLSSALALSSLAFKNYFSQIEDIGGPVGAIISALFLFGIAMLNLQIFFLTYQEFRNRSKDGAEPTEQSPKGGGFFNWLFGSLFRATSKNWQIYLVGLLFGLGFDTATEVGVLGITAQESTRGLPVSSIIIFPALFTAGMALVDTIDNVFMLEVYGWAFTNPARKLYYNMTITLLSVFVATVVGAVEVLGIAEDHLKLQGLWRLIQLVNNDEIMWKVGFGIIVMFITLWLGSVGISKMASKQSNLDRNLHRKNPTGHPIAGR
jgi:high-affinity nickel-transport protein